MRTICFGLISILLLLSTGFVIGQIALPVDAQKVSAFLDEHATEDFDISLHELRLLKTWYDQGSPVICLIGFSGRDGFVVATADPLPFRVLAFSTLSRIDPEDLPPAMEWMMMVYLQQLTEPANFSRNQQWLEKNENNEQSLAGVTPLLSSKWDQRCYYNDSCPADPLAPSYFCARAPAGCVATTLAQIMRYHKWPLQGTGSKTYQSIRYGTISAAFGATTYNIAAMPDMIFGSNPDVARLLWHAGVASHMNFGPYASGTGITDARTALVNYFGYQPSAQIVLKGSYTDVAWRDLMRSEIDIGRPVFYSGVDQATNTGHAWVLDGYTGTDYFHFNWGWSGIADGYYVSGNLNPLGSANYTAFQEAIIGIVPQGSHPVASFTADKVRVDAGESVIFTNLSGGNNTSWQWHFPGGSPAGYSGVTPPQVTYSKSGVFDVMLVVGNGTGSDTMIKHSYVQVLPLAGFRASQTVIQAGSAVNFYDASESSSPLNSWQWHLFGGFPLTASVKNPAGVIYPNPGQYPVLLKVQDGNNTDQRMALKFITVYNNCDTLLNFYMPGWSVQPVNQASFNVYQEDLDSLTPYHNQYISSGWDYFTEAGSNQFVSATSLFVTPGKADNWLIFGPVTIPSSGAELQWKHKFPDHTKRDGYEIILSTTGHTHTHFTSPPVFTVGDNDAFTLGDTAWTHCSAVIDATLYGSQNVYIGVHHFADNMFYIGLDDFMVISCDSFPRTAGLFALDTIIAVGDTVTFYDFTSGDPDQLIWHFPGGLHLNPGDAGPIVTYSQSGVYDVSLTAYFGSFSSSVTKTGYIEVKPISVDDHLTNTPMIVAVPNPFINDVFIKGFNGDVLFEIYDLQGRIVRKGKVSEGQPLDLHDLRSGLWFLRIIDDRSNQTVIRIVKQ